MVMDKNPWVHSLIPEVTGADSEQVLDVALHEACVVERDMLQTAVHQQRQQKSPHVVVVAVLAQVKVQRLHRLLQEGHQVRTLHQVAALQGCDGQTLHVGREADELGMQG